MTTGITKGQVKKAGRILATSKMPDEEYSWALDVADLWRAAHKEVIEEMGTLLRSVADGCGESLSGEILIVSRLKRMDTIVGKLRRPGLSLKLNEMNDIAGCRVVLTGQRDVELFYETLVERAPIKQENGIKNYISRPKADGYRSIHVITQHSSPNAGLNGLYCETQIRTRLQHAWATALETYDVVSGKEMKFGGGDADEKRFFVLASAIFSLAEGTPLVSGVPTVMKELREELRDLEKRCLIIEKLRACSGSVTILSNEDLSYAEYFVLDINYELQFTRIYGYAECEANEAERVFFEMERDKGALRDVLLVKAVSIKNLLDAYPNYSMDIQLFLQRLHELIWGSGEPLVDDCRCVN